MKFNGVNNKERQRYLVVSGVVICACVRIPCAPRLRRIGVCFERELPALFCVAVHRMNCHVLRILLLLRQNPWLLQPMRPPLLLFWRRCKATPRIHVLRYHITRRQEVCHRAQLARILLPSFLLRLLQAYHQVILLCLRSFPRTAH